MLDAMARACPKRAPETYTPPAWAVEAVASAPPISPADATPLIAIFRAAQGRPIAREARAELEHADEV